MLSWNHYYVCVEKHYNASHWSHRGRPRDNSTDCQAWLYQWKYTPMAIGAEFEIQKFSYFTPLNLTGFFSEVFSSYLRHVDFQKHILALCMINWYIAIRPHKIHNTFNFYAQLKTMVLTSVNLIFFPDTRWWVMKSCVHNHFQCNATAYLYTICCKQSPSFMSSFS